MLNKAEDKRRFFRVKLQSPVRFQIRGKPESNNAITDNVSTGGLCFNNDKFISPDTLLMLEFNVLSRFLNPIGRVAWVNSLPRSERFKLGVEFVEFDTNSRNFLNDYVNLQSEKL